MTEREIKKDELIPVRWERTTGLWVGQLQSFQQFLNCMVGEYRHEFENNLLGSNYNFVMYSFKRFSNIQKIKLFPTAEQIHLVNLICSEFWMRNTPTYSVLFYPKDSDGTKTLAYSAISAENGGEFAGDRLNKKWLDNIGFF